MFVGFLYDKVQHKENCFIKNQGFLSSHWNAPSRNDYYTSLFLNNFYGNILSWSLSCATHLIKHIKMTRRIFCWVFYTIYFTFTFTRNSYLCGQGWSKVCEEEHKGCQKQCWLNKNRFFQFYWRLKLWKTNYVRIYIKWYPHKFISSQIDSLYFLTLHFRL